MPLPAKNWLALWQRLDVAQQAYGTLADEFAALTMAYGETQRHYHSSRHIAECLSHLDTARALCDRADEVELALWFHDAIYDARSKDNEIRSAAWAGRVMQNAGLPQEAARRVQSLIMMTCHNALPQTRDEKVLVDIDLAILGADAARFDEYETQVRGEYAWVPGFLFKSTRRKILEAFLAREAIYATPHFHNALEKKARENLARSLRVLTET